MCLLLRIFFPHVFVKCHNKRPKEKREMDRQNIDTDTDTDDGDNQIIQKIIC